MKSRIQLARKISFLSILLLISLFNLNAQKLPKIQEESLRAPNDIKIDGTFSEWNGKFKAYNTNTQIFYTIANNDSLLFLTMRATDQLIIRKIIAGRITITFNPIAPGAPSSVGTHIIQSFNLENLLQPVSR